MEPDENELSSYYHHQPQPLHQHPQQNPTSTPNNTTSSPTNGILPNTERASHGHMVYPHSVPSAVSSPLETVRKKRGRPRKYGTPEQAAAAKRLSSSSPLPISQQRKKDQSLGGGGAPSSSNSSFKKSQLASLGSAGQGFMLHIITVAAGEDVAQKIMLCMQQSKREICIFSASGLISNPSLRQPATSGGNITYEGRFDILSLSGSYVRTELGGRTGGLSVCLSSADGQIVGGGLGGPLRAAGPVQVIVGTFIIDTKKDITAGVRGDASANKVPSPGGGVSVPSAGFPSAVDSSGRFAIRGSDDQQNIGGSQYMIQPHGMQATPSRSTDWRSVTDARNNSGYEFTGRMGPGTHESPENEDYEHIPDRD